MDISSQHFPYIVAAYALGACVLMLLAYWALRADRKVREELVHWKPDVLSHIPPCVP
jgi:hypothetical protein